MVVSQKEKTKDISAYNIPLQIDNQIFLPGVQQGIDPLRVSLGLQKPEEL